MAELHESQQWRWSTISGHGESCTGPRRCVVIDVPLNYPGLLPMANNENNASHLSQTLRWTDAFALSMAVSGSIFASFGFALGR